MAQLDFYNHNQHIAYPLLDTDQYGWEFSGSQTLSKAALLDAGFLLGIEADYDTQYRMKLQTIHVNGTDITFVFVDETGSATFSFACNVGDEYGMQHSTYADEGTEYGEAFLVTGDLALGFPDGTYTASGDYYVEPALVQTLHLGYVKQMTVGHEPRVEWHVPEDCGGSQVPLYTYDVTARNLTGHQKLKPGYNCVINMYDSTNTIEITASEGAGEGVICPWVNSSVSSMSQSSASSALSSILPTTCADVFNTINGVWPTTTGEFTLTPLSSGLRVISYPNLHKIVIDFNSGANSPFCAKE